METTLPTPIDLAELTSLIGRARLPLHSEVATQEALGAVFTSQGVAHLREYRLSASDIVDFFFQGGIALEIKTRQPKRAIRRQLERYAEHDEVRVIVLASATAVGLPTELRGKPVYTVSLGGAWL